MLKKINALVQSQSLCVLATSSAAGIPHASLMAFCAAPDLAEFWLATRTDTQKYRNLQENPRASLLVAGRAGAQEAGPAGRSGLALSVAVELVPFDEKAEADAARAALLLHHADIKDFLLSGGAMMLRLKVLRFQLLQGLDDVFIVDMGKKT